MKNKGKKYKKNIQMPPNIERFEDLFQFIWHHGIGNSLDEKGSPVQWRTESLRDAFEFHNFDIHENTISNWLSGTNAASRIHLRSLAFTISAGVDEYRIPWTKALINTRINHEKELKSRRKRRKEDLKKNSQQQTSDIKNSETYIPTDIRNDATNKERRWGFSIITATIFITLTITAIYIFNNSLAIKDFKFCDVDTFSQKNKICLVSMTEFPSDTKRVYISYKMKGFKKGQKYYRQWYRNGKSLFDKHGYHDDVWKGWTYLGNKDMTKPDLNSIAPGRYDMRISVEGEDGKSIFNSFFVIQNDNMATN